MEEYETRRGPALSSLQHGRVLVLPLRLRPRPKPMPRSKHNSPRPRPNRHSVQPRQEPRLSCEAKRRQKWLPSGDHHLLTLTTSGLASKTQRKSPTGGVCQNHHPDSQTDSWSSRMIRGVKELSFRWNRGSGSLNKSISRCFTLDRKGSLVH
jgi:hypothetical protein